MNLFFCLLTLNIYCRRINVPIPLYSVRTGCRGHLSQMLRQWMERKRAECICKIMIIIIRITFIFPPNKNIILGKIGLRIQGDLT